VKSLFSGIALAAAAGMLMGGAMKPTLDDDDRPAGPQMFAGWSGARSTGPFDDGMTFVGYQGQMPDYVLGTDMQNATIPPDLAPPLEDAPIEMAAVATEPQQAAFTGSAFDASTPSEPVPYPSIAGGVAYTPRAAAASDEPAAAPVAASLG